MQNKGLIFLDFDGVLNRCDPSGWLLERNESGLSRELVGRVAKLVDKTGASVVLSTAWREAEPLPVLKKILAGEGLNPKHVIGETPILICQSRGEEIASFMENDVTRFVVLDDNAVGRFDMSPVQQNFVRTDPRDGFTEKDAKRAEAILANGPLWTAARWEPVRQLIAAGQSVAAERRFSQFAQY